LATCSSSSSDNSSNDAMWYRVRLEGGGGGAHEAISTPIRELVSAWWLKNRACQEDRQLTRCRQLHDQFGNVQCACADRLRRTTKVCCIYNQKRLAGTTHTVCCTCRMCAVCAADSHH
jgi:hypothetical protein